MSHISVPTHLLNQNQAEVQNTPMTQATPEANGSLYYVSQTEAGSDSDKSSSDLPSLAATATVLDNNGLVGPQSNYDASKQANQQISSELQAVNIHGITQATNDKGNGIASQSSELNKLFAYSTALQHGSAVLAVSPGAAPLQPIAPPAAQQASYAPPQEVYKLAIETGVAKAKSSIRKTISLGVLAGVYISMGATLSLVVASDLPALKQNAGLQKLLFGAVFPLGLLLIVLAGADLFTSNCAMLPSALLAGRVRWWSVAKNWSIVWMSNLVGCLLMVAVVWGTQILETSPGPSSITIGKADTHPVHVTLLRAILANWLVCVAVWQSHAARDVVGKVLAIWPPITAFVAMGLEHSIANMFLLPLGLVLGAPVSVASVVVNIVIVTIGNIVGGVFGVALPYYIAYSDTIGKQS